MALGFLTTWQGNLGLCGRPGPFSLGTRVRAASTLLSLCSVRVPASSPAPVLFPESGSFFPQVLTGLKRGRWPWAEW